MGYEKDLPLYLRGLIEYVRKEARTVVGLHSETSANGLAALIVQI